MMVNPRTPSMQLKDTSTRHVSVPLCLVCHHENCRSPALLAAHASPHVTAAYPHANGANLSRRLATATRGDLIAL